LPAVPAVKIPACSRHWCTPMIITMRASHPCFVVTITIAMPFFYRRGIFLAYGRSGSLTPPYDWEGKAPNPLQPGARIAEVSSDGVLKTWIQTAIGAEHDSFLDMVSYHKNG